MKFTTFSSFPFSRELICCVLVAFSKSSSQSVQQLLVVWHEKPYFSRFSIPWTSNRATKPSWGIPRLTSVWRDSYPEKPKVRISVICFKDIRLMFETSSRKGWGWVHDGACWDRILSLWNIYIYIYIYIYNTIWDSWLLNSVKICNWKSSNSLGELEGNFWWMPINQHSHQRTKWAFNMRKVKKESGKFYLGVNPSLQVYNTIISPMWYGLCHSISMWIKFMRWKSLIKINKKKKFERCLFLAEFTLLYICYTR